MILTELSIGDEVELAVPLDTYRKIISNPMLDIVLHDGVVGNYNGKGEMPKTFKIIIAGHRFILTTLYWKPVRKWIPAERARLP